jgi:glycosyltransferase involved in cell wall biosynthesis
MRFAITARILQYDGFGMQTLLAGLVQGIAELEVNHEIFLLVDASQQIPQEIDRRKIRVVPIFRNTGSSIRKLLWDHFAIGYICKKLKIDALYASAHIRPLYAPCPVVVSVYDMMYHLFPDQWSLSDRIYFGLSVRQLTTRASAIAALSNNTKKDILDILKVKEDLVKVIYPGVPDGFRPVPSQISRPVIEKFGVSNPFILYVGSFHPRKNVDGLLDAFELIASDIPHDLVLVGPGQFARKELRTRFSESQVLNRIKVIGMVPRSELPCFYSQADVFVFPSLYEGFGFPVLEALACGCPTITSNSSSLVEVAGEAAVLVDPINTAELANGMKRVMKDNELRSHLKNRSILQAECFSWEKAARETVALLEKVASGNNH